VVVVNLHSDVSFPARIGKKILLVRMEVVRMKEVCAYTVCLWEVWLSRIFVLES